MKKKYPLTSEFLGKKPIKVIGKGVLANTVLKNQEELKPLEDVRRAVSRRGAVR